MSLPRLTLSGAGLAAMVLGFGAWAGCAHATDTLGTTSTNSTSSSATNGGTGGGGPVCPGGTMCGAVCTNTTFDPGNCGVCGHTCAPGQLCSAGQCSGTCGGGSTECGGKCVDTEHDPNNCGGCGTTCGTDEFCSSGFCDGVCLGGTVVCNGACVDTQVDPANCGGCGAACKSGEVCSQGKCGVTCTGGTTLCGNLCVDTKGDPINCGACGNVCGSGEVCAGSACGVVCLGGTQKCATKCVDQLNDPRNCGSCGHTCAPGEACVNGSCGFCLPGMTQCNATCVDLTNDPQNCGACGTVCTAPQVCSESACAELCAGTLTACGQKCLDTSSDVKNCGACGNACAFGETCLGGVCHACDSATTDCDGDGWLVADGDCCDKPGLCGSQPELVNPGAIEVVGNGIDDNCNGLTDLFDTADTVSCDGQLTSASHDPLDYAKAIGICRQTVENPAQAKDKTWGLIDARILRADGSPLHDFNAVSIRQGFGSVSPATTEGKSMLVISSGVASDATQTNPGPNGGAPVGDNVSSSHVPASTVSISSNAIIHSVADWFATANPPLKAANGLPNAPGCPASALDEANDSVMLYLRLRAPTNVKAFSFNSYFFSSEYPEYVCSDFNDQFIALVDTPNGVPSPIANPVDKNLLTYNQGGQLWPIGINIAKGTSLFSVCDAACSGQYPEVSSASCMLGAPQLAGTGFETPAFNPFDPCPIGGGTFWLTTAGNVIPGDIVELRIALWDVSDDIYDSLALIDGFRWLANATLPGTGG